MRWCVPTSRVEPRWLSAEDIIEINQDEVIETREPFALLDEGKLLGALSRPRMLWDYNSEDDIAVLASSLLFAIAESHAFIQGNKRTGFTASAIFLEVNGYSLILGGPYIQESFAASVVSVIERSTSVEAFTNAMRLLILPHEPDVAV